MSLRWMVIVWLCDEAGYWLLPWALLLCGRRKCGC